MTAYLIVRATVAEEDRDAFDKWYEAEHLPDATKAFKALSSMRGWSDEDLSIHFALYAFEDMAAVRASAASDGFKAMIAEFDRNWQGRVTRTREMFEVKQKI